MQKLAFFELSRPIQERFVEAARSGAAPAPLAFRPVVGRRVVLWSALALLAVVLLAIVASLGFGSLESPRAIVPRSWIAIYAALAAVAAACLVEALAAGWARRRLPYRPGIYLFPAGVIDASTPRFAVYRLGELEVDAAGPKAVRLRDRSGASFSFETPDARAARSAILECKERLLRAELADDGRELAALDPLKDTGFVSPFSPPTSIARPRPGWFKLALPLALLAGLPLGAVVQHARNLASERALYETARQNDDVASYEAYLARGGAREEVSEILLPRAELESARRAGTVAAIENFIARRPNSKVHAEAMAALKAALLLELEEAKKAGGVKALRVLPREHPRHALIETELAAAIRDAYERAYGAYRQRAPAADQNTSSFVKRLLAHAEKNGPRVQIRFVERTQQSHELADIAVRQSMYFAGTISTPSQYFDEARVIARERKAGQELLDQLQPAFPPEILKFELGPRLTNPTDEQLVAALPTLFIEQTTRLSGTYVSSNPRGIFVGVSMMFQARFEIPGDARPLTIKHAAWNPPKMELLQQKDGSPAVVYEASALDALRGFNQKLLAKLLAKG
jgi:hypothetical protein